SNLADLPGEPYGRPHDQGPAGRVAVEERRAAGVVDQRLDVVDLPVDRVRQRVPALAAATPVKTVDREARREQLGQLRRGAGRMDGQRAVDQDQGRSLAPLVVSDRRAVG